MVPAPPAPCESPVLHCVVLRKPWIDRATDTTTQILANLVEIDVAVIDTAGTLHLFGVETPSGVENLRHWWRTATP